MLLPYVGIGTAQDGYNFNEGKVSYDEIKQELAEIKNMLAERKYIDEAVQVIKHDLEGNGKPGWKTIRDKVLSWEVKANAIILAIAGDVIFRIVVMVTSKP